MADHVYIKCATSFKTTKVSCLQHYISPWLTILNKVYQTIFLISTTLWTFFNCGGINEHNDHFWSQDNPHWLQQTDNQYRWCVNVNKLLGQYFLTGIELFKFLKYCLKLPILLEDISNQDKNDHDGCHFSQNQKFSK